MSSVMEGLGAPWLATFLVACVCLPRDLLSSCRRGKEVTEARDLAERDRPSLNLGRTSLILSYLGTQDLPTWGRLLAFANLANPSVLLCRP